MSIRASLAPCIAASLALVFGSGSAMAATATGTPRAEPPEVITNEDLPPVPPEWQAVPLPQPPPRETEWLSPARPPSTNRTAFRPIADPATELERARAEVYRWHKLWQDPESATRINRVNRINKVNRLTRPGRRSLDAYYLRRLHEAREELERLEGRRP